MAFNPPRALWYAVSVGFVIRAIACVEAVRNPVHSIFRDDYLGMGAEWMAGGLYDAIVAPPLLVWLSAFAQLVSPANPVGLVVVVNLLASTATVMVGGLMVEKFTGSVRAGLIAAWLFALDPLLICLTPMVLTETVFIFLATLFLSRLGSATMSERPVEQRRWAVGAGCVLGVACLCREFGLIFGASALIGLFCTERKLKFKAVTAALVVGTTAIVILPWLWRNQVVYGRFEPSASRNFNVGAIYVRPAKVMHDRKNVDTLWGPFEDAPDLSGMNPFEIGDTMRPIALKFAFEHPGLMARSFLLGMAKRPLGNESVYRRLNQGRPLPRWARALTKMPRIPVFLLTVVGFGWMALNRKVRRTQLAIPAAVAVGCYLALGPLEGGRFLATLLPAWFVFAAHAIDQTLRRWQLHRPKSAPIPVANP